MWWLIYAMRCFPIRSPLWGIRMNPANPEDHVSMEYFRDPSQQAWIGFGMIEANQLSLLIRGLLQISLAWKIRRHLEAEELNICNS